MLNKRVDSDNLESLQRDSWQLELLVTGFALAGMISGFGTFTDWTNQTLGALSGSGSLAKIAGGVLVGASFAYVFILVNFFFHVVLRCLWIGAIGSRSVMGTTVMARRPLAPRFERFLRDRTGRFEDYIKHLDDAASLVFAFTFLLISTIISLLTTLLIVSLLVYLMNAIPGGKISLLLIAFLTLLIFLFALVYLVDFLTAGYLKRFRLFSRLYYPFYRFFGWVTLARIYRPLYYNLLNRRGGRYLVSLTIPYVICCVAILTMSIEPNRYVASEYITEDLNSPLSLDADHYADGDPDEPARGEIIIPSDIIRTSPMRVRIPLLNMYEGYIQRRCPDLPRHYSSSLRSQLFDGSEAGYYMEGKWMPGADVQLTREALNCMCSATELYLDGRRVDLTDVLLTKSAEDHRLHLIKFLPLDTLEPGMHQLELRQFRAPPRRQPMDTLRSTVSVPFYYAPGN